MEDNNARQERQPATRTTAGRLRARLRRMQARLKLRHRLLRMLVGGGDTALWYFDLARRQIQWSFLSDKTTANFQGRAPIERFYESLHPDDVARFQEDLDRAVETGTYNSEYRVYSQSNSRWLHARVSGQAEYKSDGSIRGILAVMRDMAPELELRREREQQEAKMNLVLGDQNLTLWAQDDKLCYLWFDTQTKNDFEQQLLGKSDYDLPESARNPALIALREQVLATGLEGTWEGWTSTSLIAPTYLKITVRPYPLPDGRRGLIGKALDLTDTIQADATVVMERAILGMSMQIGHISAAVQDADFRTLWLTDTIIGLKSEDIIGKTDDEVGKNLGVPDEMMAPGRERKQRILRTGKGEALDEHTLWEGKEYFLRNITEPYTLPDGSPGLIAVSIDISNLKRQEQALIDQSRLLMIELEAKRRELDEARQMQHAMMPRTAPQLPQGRLAMHMQTCEEVGGDYLDYLALPDGKFLLALGDATGHGMKAGILVAAVKSFFYSLGTHTPPAAMLNTIHAHIKGMSLPQMFMGLTIASIESQAVEIAIAGMPPVYVYRAATGQAERVVRPSMFLGGPQTQPYGTLRLPIAAGDVLLICSDGLLEAFSAERKLLGEDIVIDTLCQQAAQAAEPEAIKAALLEVLNAHTAGAPLHDDVTLAVYAHSL